MKKVAVILGAGASADAWNQTGPPANHDWRPPLANELFGQRPAFWEILRNYPGAHALATDLGELVRQGRVNIEAKLREYADQADARIREHFKQVPLYLRDLIIAVVQKYTPHPVPGTHSRLIWNLLSSGVSVAFIDLNYDNYVETALGYFDSDLLIRGLDDYVAKDRQAIICKVHGSVNWGTPLGQDVGLWVALRQFDPRGPKTEIVWESSTRSCTQWTDQQRRTLYPVLTAPLAGKGHMDLVCPRFHLQALQGFLSDCEHYLVIGTSAQDEDLLAFLRQSVKSVRTLHCVSNRGPTAEETYVRLKEACPAFTMGQGRVFLGGGFRAYLDSDEFRLFLGVARG